MCVIVFRTNNFCFTDIVVLTIHQTQGYVCEGTIIHFRAARAQKTSAAYIFRPRNDVEAPSGSVDAGQPNRYPQ